MKSQFNGLALILIFVIASVAGSAAKGAGRLDIQAVGDPILAELSSATVALMRPSHLDMHSDGTATVLGPSFGNAFNLCPSEPFQNQISAAYCSGFLVSPDTVLTAGHCLADQSDCEGTLFVFGYSSGGGSDGPIAVQIRDIYSCEELMYRQSAEGGDFAVVRLNRPVLGRPPLVLNRGGVPAVGDPLAVIGYPSGLPMKVAFGTVTDNTPSAHFVANVDTFEGNSGSAVLNMATGKVEGILVRGSNDFISLNLTSGQTCSESVSEDQRDEDVTRIDQILPSLGYVDESGNAHGMGVTLSGTEDGKVVLSIESDNGPVTIVQSENGGPQRITFPIDSLPAEPGVLHQDSSSK